MRNELETAFSEYKKGSFDSFQFLFERFKNPIYKLSLSKVRSTYDSMDILNSTFERLHITRSLYLSHFEIHRWIFVITLSEIHRHLNHSPRVSFEMKSDHDFKKQDFERGFEDALTTSLKQMDDEKEAELSIRFLDGLAFEEIATRLKILKSDESEIPNEAWLEDWKAFRDQLEAANEKSTTMKLALNPDLESRIQNDLRKRLLFSGRKILSLLIFSILSLILANYFF